jgi:hypothetical protein
VKYSIYAHAIDKNNEILVSRNKIPNDVLIEIHKTYTPKLLQYLKELRPELVDSYTFSDITLVAIRGNKKFPIHCDLPNKLLSVVVYISPENNIGTILYRDREGNNKHTVEWKQNRSLIFSRTNDSWHSYNSDGKALRIVLVYNLRNDNIEKIKEKIKKNNSEEL